MAILLVVLFHADLPGFGGGYVGVDVFFVISGYVITGVLVRERNATASTSIAAFYGRRARRIIPVACLVLVVTIVAAYILINRTTGRATAVDGQWAAVFLANLHFAATQTNYLASLRPPSSLQNYWSLAVEEQFYIVYPVTILLVAKVSGRTSLRARMGIVLGAVVVTSYIWSVVLTSTNASDAFFSPLTRAWELALGGLVAVSYDQLRRVPPLIANIASWTGLGAILVASTAFSSSTPYPGSLVAVPVIGAGLIIAAGSSQPAWGAESFLRLRPLQWIGLVSYSWYLWHWPILVIAAQSRGTVALPIGENVLLVLGALGLAAVTYRWIENPIRRNPSLVAHRWLSIGMGVGVVLVALAVASYAVMTTSPELVPGIAVAQSGSNCPSPSKAQITPLQKQYEEVHPTIGTDGPRQISMLVVGDSTACTMLSGLTAVGAANGIRTDNGAVIGCGIVSGATAPFYNGFTMVEPTKNCFSTALRAERSALTRTMPNVILWASTDERNSIVDTPGSNVFETGSPQWKALLLQRVDDRIQSFLATGAKVVLVLEPPPLGLGSREASVDSQYREMNAILKTVASRHPGKVATVDLAPRVCPAGPPCPPLVVDHGAGDTQVEAVRPDGLHYGPAGALWVAEWLVPKVLAAASKLR